MPPFNRRIEKWMEEIGEELRVLGLSEKIDLNTLSENEEFISTVANVSALILKTHKKEKLTLFKNIIINKAKDKSINEDTENLFMHFVDYFTTTHIKILKLFQNPKEKVKPNVYSSGLGSAVLEYNMPELKDKRVLYDLLWRDLHIRGLVNTDGLHGLASAEGLKAKRTTDFGDEFIKFISK